MNLNADEINYSANAKIIQGSYNLLDSQYQLENLKIEIQVNPDVVNFNGEGIFFNLWWSLLGIKL